MRAAHSAAGMAARAEATAAAAGAEEKGAEDGNVKRTAAEAAASKASVARLGYLRDEWVQFFCRSLARKPPLINRGYFARMWAFQTLLSRFLRPPRPAAAQGLGHGQGQAEAAERRRSALGRRQVVVLGGGFDTSYFKLMQAGVLGPGTAGDGDGNEEAKEGGEGVEVSGYFEVDFEDVIVQKYGTIRRTEALRKLLGVERDGRHSTSWGVQIGRYRLVQGDLRDTEECVAGLIAAGFDPQLPTIFISECVLVYLEKRHAERVIQTFAQQCPNAVFVTYDMIKPHDSFGRTMQANLQRAGCNVPGLLAFPDTDSHRARFQEHGFDMTHCATMRTVFEHFIPTEEQQRVSRIEMLDEVEEWHMIMEHYALTVACKGDQVGRFAEDVGFADELQLQDKIRAKAAQAVRSVTPDSPPAPTSHTLAPTSVPAPVTSSPGALGSSILTRLNRAPLPASTMAMAMSTRPAAATAPQTATRAAAPPPPTSFAGPPVGSPGGPPPPPAGSPGSGGGGGS